MQSVQNASPSANIPSLPLSTSIGVTSARDELPRMIDEVQYWSSTFVINKNGKAAAALVPINVLEQWQTARSARFAVIDRIQEQGSNLNLSEEEINSLINEAIDEVRQGGAQASHE